MSEPILRVLVDGPLPGAMNMAVDEALMDSGRRGEVTLRLYRWSPGCLSFGRNQTAAGRYDGERARALGYQVVRRPTGGRSVLHDRELTYSVTAPADWGTLREAYLRINRALAAGLRILGIDASVQRSAAGPTPRPTIRACFRDPLPGELTAGGRKLAGSAQWRDSGALLQHGSLLLHNDQSMVEQLSVGAAAELDVPAVGLVELLGREPQPDELEGALAEGFERELRLRAARGILNPGEREAAERLLARYEDPEWTWRR
jgi:lipoate-protein ligase A